MKKLLKGLLLVVFAAFFCVAVACKNDANEDSGQPTLYTISVSEKEYETSVGEEFTLPTATVTPSLPTDVAVETRVAFGSEVVEVVDSKFVPSKEGIYTITYTLSGGVEFTPIKVTVTAVQSLIPSTAPTNVQIDETGVITFSVEEGRKCALYMNGERKGTVVSGQDVSAFIFAGKDIAVTVKVEEDDTYAASEHSTAVLVSKAAATEIRFADGILTFTERTGESYELLINGESKGVITSGSDIQAFLDTGTNDIAVIAKGGEGVFDSALSNTVTLMKHNQITDFAIDEKGIVTFTERYGFQYLLCVGESEQGEIENGTNLSETLDAQRAGELVFKVKTLANGENCYIPEGEKYSNEVTVVKLATPNAPEIQGNRLTFEELDGCVYTLYVDGAERGIVQSGAPAIPYYTNNEKVSFSLRVSSENAWKSNVGAAVEFTVPTKYHIWQGTGRAVYGYEHTYASFDVISGVKLSGATGTDMTASGLVIPFSGTLMHLGLDSFQGGSGLSAFNVVFTDVTTKKTAKILFTSTADSRAADSIFAAIEYNGATTAAELLSADLYDSGTGYYYGGQQKRFIEIGVENGAIRFSPGQFSSVWSNVHPQRPDLTGFGADGVSVSVEFVATENAENGVILSNVGNTSFIEVYETAPLKGEANQSHSYNGTHETVITGTKYTATENGEGATVAQGVAFAGKMIEFGFCNNGGTYTVQDFIVSFKDVTTEKILSVRFTLNDDVKNMGAVYITYSFDGGAYSPLTWFTCDMSDGGVGPYGEQKETMSIEYASGQIKFSGSNPSDWSTGYNLSNVLPTDFGANGVDIGIRFETIKETSSVIIN